jgi:hypothetical protein
VSRQPSRIPLSHMRHTPPRVVADVWAYLAQQFPPMQAASVGAASVASYAIYGQEAGRLEVDGHGLLAAVLVVILFLQYRLTDDIATIYDSELSASIPARPTVLMAAVVSTLSLEFVLEPHRQARLVVLGILTLMILGSTISSRGKRSAVLPFLGRVTFVEIVPIAIFFYVYVAWHDSMGMTVSTAAVAAAIGAPIVGFQFWKWSRDLGDEPVETIYLLSWPRVRGVLLLLTGLAVAVNAVLFVEAELSMLYLIYVLGVCLVFAVLVSPRGQRDDTKPFWAGLTFPIILWIGLYTQLLALAV